MNRDMLFLAGQFLTGELPASKQYLSHYFKSTVQRQFVCYYTLFGDYDNFVDHTGVQCTRHWLDSLVKKLKKLEAIRLEARSEFDLTLVAKIESGKYPKRKSRPKSGEDGGGAETLQRPESEVESEREGTNDSHLCPDGGNTCGFRHGSRSREI